MVSWLREGTGRWDRAVFVGGRFNLLAQSLRWPAAWVLNRTRLALTA
jgi:hypothetical protein